MKSSLQDKRRNKELSMTMPITESSLEQHSQISSHMNGSSLDHDVSTNVPWLLDPIRSQNFLDTLKIPSSYNADYHMLREQDPQYSSNPASYEVKSCCNPNDSRRSFGTTVFSHALSLFQSSSDTITEQRWKCTRFEQLQLIH